MAASPEPLRLGLIGDIQYADVDDATDFSGREKRHFRNALLVAESAIDIFNALGCDGVVQMGDIIDGLNSKRGPETSGDALFSVLEVLNRSNAPLGRFDLVGNHELYNFPRKALSSLLNCSDPASGTLFRLVHLNAQWDAIFLDPYEVGLIGNSEEDAGAQKAREILQEMNPNVLDSVRGGDWFSGVPVERHRYVPYNGGVSEEQLSWLRASLAASAEAGRRVLVFTHVPLFQGATKPSTVVWNAEEVLDAIHEHPETVVAVLAGHDHDGGYAMDSAGVHHVTLAAPLTTDVGCECCAILECHEGWAMLRSVGKVVVESGTRGQGRSYPELLLVHGSPNDFGELSNVGQQAAEANVHSLANGKVADAEGS